MAESQLNDAELRAVRAMIKNTATLPSGLARILTVQTYGADSDPTTAIDLCRAALPAPMPEPEPEIVVKKFTGTGHGEGLVIQCGDEYFNGRAWTPHPFTFSLYWLKASVIASALRAREKAAKRPRIEVVEGTYSWGVQCGEHRYCCNRWMGGKVSAGSYSEPEARTIAAKLEANGNYPPGVEVTK